MLLTSLFYKFYVAGYLQLQNKEVCLKMVKLLLLVAVLAIVLVEAASLQG